MSVSLLLMFNGLTSLADMPVSPVAEERRRISTRLDAGLAGISLLALKSAHRCIGKPISFVARHHSISQVE